jgi:DNA polymerase I-like protein with 3'-5' exonuclease and polymerase domains
MLSWWINYEGSIGELLLQVHDSILVQVKLGREKLAAKLLKNCLEKPLDINGTTLVIPADVETGPNWATMETV